MYNFAMISLSFPIPFLRRTKAKQKWSVCHDAPLTLPPPVSGVAKMPRDEVLQEIAVDALAFSGLVVTKPVRIVFRETPANAVLLMIDVDTGFSDTDAVERAEHSIETNALAILGLSAAVYLRASTAHPKFPHLEDPEVRAAIRHEIKALRQKRRSERAISLTEKS